MASTEEWTPLTKYSKFVKQNPPRGSGQIKLEVRFPRSNPDICQASSYRDLARAILCWSSLVIRQEPKSHPEPKAGDKLVLVRAVIGKDQKKEGGYAVLNSRGCHPNGDRFEGTSYLYPGVPKIHVNLDQTAKNMLFGITEFLRLYNIPAEKIQIRRI